MRAWRRFLASWLGTPGAPHCGHVTSINAVLRNKAAMATWIALIVAAIAIGFATAFVGLAITMPVIGHATWHAYREAIDASAWPAGD